jgi:hypothetical protein
MRINIVGFTRHESRKLPQKPQPPACQRIREGSWFTVVFMIGLLVFVSIVMAYGFLEMFRLMLR